jgi:hypothetical protein
MLTLALCSLMLIGAAAAMAEESTRLTATTQGLKSAVDSGQGVTSYDEFQPLATNGTRDNKTRGAAQSKLSASESRTPNTDFWFYSADVELFSDQDRDGYYYGIDLLFDADTVYAAADVYAVVYLSLDGGPWEEYAETDTFSIYGSSGDDEYTIVTELISGYPTGSYDILIELFDTWDGSFVADIGPEDTSELSYLPLEDADRDAPAAGGTTVIIREGGGSFGWLMLLGLTLVAARRRQA